MAKSDYFTPGSVVVPAQDGLLSSLGYDVNLLNLDALGVVLERGSRRSLVNFTEIAKKHWIDFSELADVQEQVEEEVLSYKRLLPDHQDQLNKEKVVWLIAWLMKNLSLVQALELELGSLEDVWDPAHGEKLETYFSGDFATECCRLSLGLSAFGPDQQEKAKQVLGDRLLFTQIKPAGMHKFEVAFYLRRE